MHTASEDAALAAFVRAYNACQVERLEDMYDLVTKKSFLIPTLYAVCCMLYAFRCTQYAVRCMLFPTSKNIRHKCAL
jgi:hypothetical protein